MDLGATWVSPACLGSTRGLRPSLAGMLPNTVTTLVPKFALVHGEAIGKVALSIDKPKTASLDAKKSGQRAELQRSPARLRLRVEGRVRRAALMGVTGPVTPATHVAVSRIIEANFDWIIRRHLPSWPVVRRR